MVNQLAHIYHRGATCWTDSHTVCMACTATSSKLHCAPPAYHTCSRTRTRSSSRSLYECEKPTLLSKATMARVR